MINVKLKLEIYTAGMMEWRSITPVPPAAERGLRPGGVIYIEITKMFLKTFHHYPN